PLVRAAFPDPVGGAGEAAGAEGLGVEGVDFVVMGRVFRQVGDVGKSHRCVPGRKRVLLAARRLLPSAPVRRGHPFVVVPGGFSRTLSSPSRYHQSAAPSTVLFPRRKRSVRCLAGRQSLCASYIGRKG